MLAVAALMASTVVSAQDELQNEVSVGYGGGSNTDIVSSIAGGFFTGKQIDYWGPVSVEYFRFNQEGRLGFGGIFAVAGCKWDDSSSAKSTYFTLMPSVKYKWLNKAHFAMYSKAAVGLTVKTQSASGSDDKTKAVFNWQASAVGMEFGGAFRGFLELGMGEQGIILVGLRYRF